MHTFTVYTWTGQGKKCMISNTLRSLFNVKHKLMFQVSSFSGCMHNSIPVRMRIEHAVVNRKDQTCMHIIFVKLKRKPAIELFLKIWNQFVCGKITVNFLLHALRILQSKSHIVVNVSQSSSTYQVLNYVIEEKWGPFHIILIHENP